MSIQRRSLVASAIAVVICVTGLAAYAITGPSSSASPYVLRAKPGVVSAAILTVGDAVGAYRLVGIPDGLGVGLVFVGTLVSIFAVRETGGRK